MEKDYADPEAVLRHDYVGLLMLAAQNGPQLRLLIHWGKWAPGELLRHCIGVIQANCPSDSTARRVQVDKTWNDPVSLLDCDPAGVAIRTKGNSSLQSQLVEFGAQLEHYAKMNETLLRRNNAEEARPNAALSGDTLAGSEETLSNIKSEEEAEPETAPVETAVSEEEALEAAGMEERVEPDPINVIQEGAASGVEASGDGAGDNSTQAVERVRSKRKRMTPKEKALWGSPGNTTIPS